MRFLLGLLLPLAVVAQNPYGPSQLHQYLRLLASGNLGGFGQLQEAINQGTVRNIGDIDGTPRLQGLPPLPLTHDEVMRQLTSTPKPTTTAATARPTTATTPPPMMAIYAVNTAPEMPPRPEERIHGKYDDDGVFHPDEDSKEQLKLNKIQGTKIKEFPEKDQPQDDANDYEGDDFYDEAELRVQQRRVVRQQQQRQVDGAVQRRQQQLQQQRVGFQPPHDKRKNQRGSQKVSKIAPQKRGGTQRTEVVHPRQIQPAPAFRPPQSAPLRPPPPPPPPQPQYPSFVFQPRPPATGRDQVLSNLLTEIEEYDDFLDQHQSYKERFPHSGPVNNPYRLLPEGQLPTLPRAIQTQPQQAPPQAPPPPPPQPRPQFAPIPSVAPPQPQQVQPAPWTLNGVPAHAAAAQTATEHPLLSIFNLFRVPQAHAAPTFSQGGVQIPLVDINQRPLALGGLFSNRRR